MSNQCIVIDGDLLQFNPQFGHRQVTPTGPATIRGTGHATINKRHVCVVGDEKKVQVPAQYTIPGYSPGMGVITIAVLAGDQQAPHCKSNAALILKGQQFTARFTPTQPAISATSPHPADAPAPSMGQGRFNTSQMFVKAKN